jgi:hypothetical protein
MVPASVAGEGSNLSPGLAASRAVEQIKYAAISKTNGITLRLRIAPLPGR